ncbi:MAG: phytanoyl-CoA dioxygenase family protein [Phycisphaerales bacterium]
MLTESETAFYRDQGYLVVPGVLDETRINELRKLIDEHLHRAIAAPTRGTDDQVDMNPDGTPVAVYRLSRVMNRHPAFRAVATDPKISAVARDLLGADAAVCLNRHNMMVAKAPRLGRPIAWHQDGATWGHDGLLALIVFLSDAHPGNGCLEIMPGLHRRGILPSVDEKGFACMDMNHPELASLAMQALPVVAHAGDALFFHALLPHASKANTSEQGRPTLTFAYVRESQKALRFPTGMEAIQTLPLSA